MDRQVPEVRRGRDTPKAGDPVLSRAEVPTPIPTSPGGAVGPGPHTEAENLLPEGSSPQCRVGRLSPSQATLCGLQSLTFSPFSPKAPASPLGPGGPWTPWGEDAESDHSLKRQPLASER